jgi:hypothetical protein
MNRTLTLVILTIQSILLSAQNNSISCTAYLENVPLGSFLLPNGNLRMIYASMSGFGDEQIWLADQGKDGSLVQKKQLGVSGSPFGCYMIPIADGNAILIVQSFQCDFFQYLGLAKVDVDGNIAWFEGTSKPGYSDGIFQLNHKQMAAFSSSTGNCWPIDLATGKFAAAPVPVAGVSIPFVYQGDYYYTAAGNVLRKHLIQNDSLVLSGILPGRIRSLIALSNTDLVFAAGTYFFRSNSENLQPKQLINTGDSLQTLVATDNGGFLTSHYHPTKKLTYYSPEMLVERELAVTDTNLIWFQAWTKNDILYLSGKTKTNKNTSAYSMNTSLSQPDLEYQQDVTLTQIKCLDTVKITTDAGALPFLGGGHRATYGDVMVTIKNSGTQVLDSITVCFRTQGCQNFCPNSTHRKEVFRNLNLQPGQDVELLLEQLYSSCFIDDPKELCLWLISPNGELDKNQADNVLCISDFITTSTLDPIAVQFEITPNPTSELLRVACGTENGQMQTIEIFDALGQVVQTENNINQNEVQLNLDTLPVGNYLVRVKTDKGIGVQKVCVMR